VIDDLPSFLPVFRGNRMNENLSRQSALLDPFKKNPIIVERNGSL
jgi:hypothetical protein